MLRLTGRYASGIEQIICYLLISINLGEDITEDYIPE